MAALCTFFGRAALSHGPLSQNTDNGDAAVAIMSPIKMEP
jgi:hypothetical protein